MAKIITRTNNYFNVTFKCYDKSVGDLKEVTEKIECKKGEEIITALKTGVLGGNFVPVDVIKSEEKTEKRYMTVEDWLKYSKIFTENTAKNNEEV